MFIFIKLTADGQHGQLGVDVKYYAKVLGKQGTDHVRTQYPCILEIHVQAHRMITNRVTTSS